MKISYVAMAVTALTLSTAACSVRAIPATDAQGAAPRGATPTATKPADPSAAAQQPGAGTEQPVDGDAPVAAAGKGPLALTKGFYVDPGSQALAWVKSHPGDARAARIKASIGLKPGARWFGNWSGNITSAVSSYVKAAAAKKKLPILVAYNIPGRDCGGASSGGAGSPAAYRTWIAQFAAAIGKRPAIVVIEPDAVAQLDCMPANARTTRLALLKYATQQFKAKSVNTWAYLDGGNAKWIPAATMAQRLNSAGVKNIRGFAVNVSNFYTTAQSVTYAKAINTGLSTRFRYTRRYVIDTSRNAKGSLNNQWCNPATRKLGVTSRTSKPAEFLLWIKSPGESDGPCGTAPNTPAGQFNPALATRLIAGT